MKSEIGIDFHNFFRGALGTSLVYKRRFGEKNFVSTNEKKAFRFRVGGSGSLPIAYEESETGRFDTLSTTFPNSTILQNNLFEDEKSISVFLLTGIEWQRQKDRFQYYFGFEMGFWHTKISETNRYRFIVNSNIEGSTYELIEKRRFDNQENSILLNGLAGFKFFINPRFSLSIESSIETSFRMSNYNTIFEDIQNETEEVVQTKRKRLFYSFDYLNALFVSYYF